MRVNDVKNMSPSNIDDLVDIHTYMGVFPSRLGH